MLTTEPCLGAIFWQPATLIRTRLQNPGVINTASRIDRRLAVGEQLCAAGAIAVTSVGATASRRRRTAFHGAVKQLAVDLTVREAPATITLTSPGAELQEQTRQRLADQYRLLLFSEITLSFTDTDGDHIRLQKDGIDINEYVNGELEVKSGKFFHIDAISRAYRIGAGHGWLRPEDDVETIVRRRDLMYMDREFTARCLITICSLNEPTAYQVMMTAHTEGLAVVGTYTFEAAEAYCDGLKAKGLSADIAPVDGNCD